MRSVVHSTFGEPAEVLAFGESPLPEPAPGQVRVRMRLSPIHNHDLWTVRGQYGTRPPLPAIGGSEAMGVVDSLGEGVEGLAIGQRVAAAGARGAWAECFVVPANALVPVPDAIDDATAAQLVAMPLSALMLLETLGVSEGDWIVQNAANGAVGKALALLAHARGVRVLNLVRRDEGVAEMAAQGIGDTVCTMHDGWKATARALMGGSRPRAGVDSVGGPASGVLASLLGENGLLVSFGSMTGEPMQIPSGELIFKQITVKGFWGTPASKALSAEDRRRLMGELLQRA
ncbi:MAG: alcohol dehydrogenase, partial [Lysobacteraceae bacterium]